MEVRRTVPVKLNVADSDADLLHNIISEFLWAANYVGDHAWQGEYKTTSKSEVQRETDEVVDKHDLHRVTLPRHSPDLNPIEQIWKSVKRDLSPLDASDLETYRELIRSVFHDCADRISLQSRG